VRVDLKRTYGDWAAISKGISNGDVVVTDGQLALTPGAKVKIVKSDNTPKHRAGPATGSVSEGTPMNTMTGDKSDNGGPPSDSDMDSSLTKTSQDQTNTQPIPGNYGESNTPSVNEAPLSPAGSHPGSHQGHHGGHGRGFAFGEEHGAAPLKPDSASTAAPSGNRQSNQQDKGAESQP
jgi:hypothetical protein